MSSQKAMRATSDSGGPARALSQSSTAASFQLPRPARKIRFVCCRSSGHRVDRIWSAATQKFDTVELNASFYRWPQQPTFGGWSHRLPQDSG
jgi:hypothetical protein